LSCLDEKNERVKESIRKKIQEYLDRAEKLKEVVQKPTKKKAMAASDGSGAAK
jgi:vacuolar protein-sorting-associated protein 4